MTATQSKIQRSKAAAPAAAGGLSSVPIRRSGGGAALSDYLFSHYRVSDPSDQSEVQAERAADKVMSGGQVHASEAAPGGVEIARSPEGGETPAGGRTGGSTGLPGPVQERMEGAFGRSFEGVRVHHDQRADSLSRGFHADAFTQGSDIYFREGAYDPATRQGQHLIAHELAHVDQGGAGILRALTEGEVRGFVGDQKIGQFVWEAITHKDKLKEAIWAEKEPGVAKVGAAKGTSMGFAVLGKAATLAGSSYSSIAATGLPNGDDSQKKIINEHKRNANYLAAAGHAANATSSGIDFFSNWGKRRGASKDMDEFKGGAGAQDSSITDTLNELVILDRNTVDFTEQESETYSKILTDKNKQKYKDLLQEINKMINALRKRHVGGNGQQERDGLEDRLVHARDALWEHYKIDKTKSLKYKLAETQKADSVQGMWKSGLNTLGSLASGGGALWNAISGVGLGGSIMSAAGGLLSTMGGFVDMFGGSSKTNRATENKKRANTANRYAVETLQTLSGYAAEAAGLDILLPDKTLDGTKLNGEADNVVAVCGGMVELYQDMKFKGIDVDKITGMLDTGDAEEIKDAIVQGYSGG